ncbi:reverse transcriptase domain-containing protein [Tanacetum coccineum]
MGVKNLQANVDSRLVANQVNGTYVAKETDMIRYLEKVNTLTSSFKAFSIKQVPRSENKKADVLSKIASTSFAHLSKQVLVEELKEKSISATEVLAIVEEEGDTWMTPIFKYLTDGTLPTKHARRHTIRHGKSLADWLLLANHARGRKNANKSMPRMSDSDPRGLISDNRKAVPGNPLKIGVETMLRRISYSHYPTERKMCIPTEIRTCTTTIGQRKWICTKPRSFNINLDCWKNGENNSIVEAKASKNGKVSKSMGPKQYEFKPGDLVYRNNEASRAEDTGKLGPK